MLLSTFTISTNKLKPAFAALLLIVPIALASLDAVNIHIFIYYTGLVYAAVYLTERYYRFKSAGWGLAVYHRLTNITNITPLAVLMLI